MGRLFISPKEINFVNDITKELVKDVIGEEIFYFPISAVKSDVHGVYEEAINKVFENPIAINALVNWGEAEVRTGKFATETVRTTEVYLQNRDLIDKQIEVYEGDFFSYGTLFFEIISRIDVSLMFGQVEYGSGIKITAKEARKGQFRAEILGRVSEEYDEPIDPFVQQRGYAENLEGITGDIRALEKNKILTHPISRPRKVTKDGFYDED